MDFAKLFFAFSLVLPGMFVNANHYVDDGNCNRSLVLGMTGSGNIQRYDIGTRLVSDVTYTNEQRNVVGMEVDHERSLLFYSDTLTHHIYMKDYRLDTDTTELLSFPEDSVVDGLAVHAAQGLLFYTQYQDTPSAASVSEAFIKGIHYSGQGEYVVLEYPDVQRPRAIVVDEAEWVIYYTDWGEFPHVARTSYDGQSRELITDEGLRHPNGLALDSEQGLLYLCDSGTDKVEVINLSNFQRNQLFFDVSLHLFALELSHDHQSLYMSQWNENQVEIYEMSVLGGLAYPVVGGANVRTNGFREICYPRTHPTDPTQVCYGPLNLNYTTVAAYEFKATQADKKGKVTNKIAKALLGSGRKLKVPLNTTDSLVLKLWQAISEDAYTRLVVSRVCLKAKYGETLTVKYYDPQDDRIATETVDLGRDVACVEAVHVGVGSMKLTVKRKDSKAEIKLSDLSVTACTY